MHPQPACLQNAFRNPHLHSQHHQLPKDAAKGQTSDEIEIPHVTLQRRKGTCFWGGNTLQAYGNWEISDVLGQAS